MAQVYVGIGSNIEPERNIRSGLTTDDLALYENGLRIPRDEITRHAFVLRPLAEVAGDRPSSARRHLRRTVGGFRSIAGNVAAGGRGVLGEKIR
jgi:7,8-dihydro-6-hydroxymethylpterin-pyrophosphokinase